MFQITKSILNRSTGTECPALTSKCQVTIKNFTSFPDSMATEEFLKDFHIKPDVKNEFLCCEPRHYYSGIFSECLKNMKESEISEFAINFVKVDSNKLTSCKFTLELHSFLPGKDFYELNLDKRIIMCDQWKSFGNTLFTSGLVYMAGYWYNKSLHSLILCCTDNMEDVDIKERYQKLMCQCRNNLAAVQLKNCLYKHVISNCSEVLTIDSTSVKALYRRARAYHGEGKPENAMKDLKQALKIEPNSISVRNLIALIKGTNMKKTDNP